ncbi:MAG: Rid family hydrolase [bacterium]
MPNRRNFTTGNPWEQAAGFSRAVLSGDTIYTAGTVAVNREGIVQGANCYEQCRFICSLLEGVLKQAGATLSDVIQVRCYLIDKADAEQFTRFMAEVFGQIAPAATCVIVSGLFGEGTLVELEFVARIRQDQNED